MDGEFHKTRTRVYLGLAGLVFLVHALLIGIDVGGPETRNALLNLAALIAPLLAACFILWAAQRMPGTQTAWRFLGVGALSWAVGQIVWTYYEVVLGSEVPFPSFADIGYLGLIPLAAIGILTLLPAPSTPSARLRLFLDAAIIATSLLLISWVLVLEGVYRNASGTAFENGVALAYPMGDIAIATLIVLVAARTGTNWRFPFLRLALGLLIFAVADSAFALLVATGQYETGAITDLGWTTGFLLIGFAAVTASVRPTLTHEPLRRSSAAAVIIPNAPVVLGLALAAVEVIRLGDLDSFLFWALVVMGVLVLGRQLLTQLEDLRLARRTEAAFKRLQELEDERERLLRTIIHELNGPLTPLAVQAYLLLESKTLTAGERKSIEIIERNTKQLKTLVSDLRDTSSIGAGRLKMEMKLVDLRDILHIAADSHADVARANRISLNLKCEAPLPATVDPQRMTQVLYNLLSNAIKFTPEGGTVYVFGGPNDGAARIQVQDSGRGLTVDEMGRLFMPFSQVHKTDESRERGTGLGLFISKAIVEVHRGRIWCESPGPGKGSSFTFEVPLDARPFEMRNAPRPASGSPSLPPGHANPPTIR